jgi:hypothetical protein
MTGGDPTKKDIPINPPIVPDSKTLWYTMHFQCSVAAGFSSGPPELPLMDANDGKHPSEKKRMEDATKK